MRRILSKESSRRVFALGVSAAALLGLSACGEDPADQVRLNTLAADPLLAGQDLAFRPHVDAGGPFRIAQYSFDSERTQDAPQECASRIQALLDAGWTFLEAEECFETLDSDRLRTELSTGTAYKRYGEYCLRATTYVRSPGGVLTYGRVPLEGASWCP
jgi:hypothetical protein